MEWQRESTARDGGEARSKQTHPAALLEVARIRAPRPHPPTPSPRRRGGEDSDPDSPSPPGGGGWGVGSEKPGGANMTSPLEDLLRLTLDRLHRQEQRTAVLEAALLEAQPTVLVP